MIDASRITIYAWLEGVAAAGGVGLQDLTLLTFLGVEKAVEVVIVSHGVFL